MIEMPTYSPKYENQINRIQQHAEESKTSTAPGIKYPVEVVREARRLRDEGKTYRQISDQTGVNYGSVAFIVNRRRLRKKTKRAPVAAKRTATKRNAKPSSKADSNRRALTELIFEDLMKSPDTEAERAWIKFFEATIAIKEMQ